MAPSTDSTILVDILQYLLIREAVYKVSERIGNKMRGYAKLQISVKYILRHRTPFVHALGIIATWTPSWIANVNEIFSLHSVPSRSSMLSNSCSRRTIV